MIDTIRDSVNALRSLAFVLQRAIKPKPNAFYLINLTGREPTPDPRGAWDNDIEIRTDNLSPEEIARETLKFLREEHISSRRTVYLSFMGPATYLPAILDSLGDDRHRISLRWLDLRDNNKQHQLPRPRRNYVPLIIAGVSVLLGFLLPW